jgi:hypothetical protein
MTSLVGLVIIIVLSYLIIKVGAISLRMTGVDKESAIFQSLSAFTGTGFTTFEAEDVVNYSDRRKVIKILMLLGNAGIVSIIAMLIVSFAGTPSSQVFTKLGVIGIVILVIVVVSVVRGLDNLVDRFIERRLSKFTHFSMGAFSEMLKLADGYGVAEIDLPEDHPMAGQRIHEAELRSRDVLILAIKRGISLIPAPRADEHLRGGDKLVCFGPLRNIAAVADEGSAPSA